MLLNFRNCSSVIEQLGGKQRVMQLLGHEDPNVRYEALLAVQKLMVHNWYVALKHDLKCIVKFRLNINVKFHVFNVVGNT